MSKQTSEYNDGGADAVAATAIISIIVFSLYLWLSGMPH
ncbi:methionine synthase [Parahaliea mediterranea]|uniref:Methionine synthase n=1 Tax=Parahaliea mediterranea TaxID=651086 RepID=A0A939IJI5_9GAMM|nr:methionine synthase [Parahaliea mediterranea]MBN7797699.1 methionine synthase [Parahaliea mediterranea]